MSNQIPKILWQTWYKKDIPGKIRESIDCMKQLHSDYIYNFFSDDDIHDYIKKNFSNEIYLAYCKLNVGAAKADLWRYLVMYDVGGVYIDLDSIIYTNVDSLLEDRTRMVISREKNKDVFVQWCLMCPPRHDIMKYCIEKSVENIYNNSHSNVVFLTGPIVYSQSIQKFFKDVSVYDKSDFCLNSMTDTCAKFYRNDYTGYALFSNPEKYLLYKDKPHWSTEERVFK